MSSQIAVTGSLAYDYISSYERPFEKVLLPDKLAELSVCFLVHDKVRHFGGTGGNIAYNLALLEESATLVAAVGYDFGDYKKWLSEKNVDLKNIKVFSKVPTASATIMTDPKGHQIAQFHPGAMSADEPINTEDAFKEVKAIIIAPDDSGRVMQYIREAKSAGTPYFFDPGQNMPIFTPEQLHEAIDGAEGLFLNDYELEMFKKRTHLDLVDILEKVKLLIVTRGKEGSEIYTPETSALSPIKVPVAVAREMVDPTGCGDGYRAGFLKGYVEGRELKACGRMGALMATYVVENIGTQNHHPSYEEFVNRYEETFGAQLR